MLVPRTLSTIVHSPARVQEMAGPVGIAQVTGQVARSNQLEGIVYLVAMLSANLFAVNLLPMPALDGGRIAFVLLEWLRGGRRIPHRWETLIHLVGMVLALGLLAAVTVFDVLRLANGGP
jgi:regulator of sigma E protease